jgi:hypothetical protein
VSVVGTLTVDLVANTATFTADLGKAGNSLDGLGKSAAAAGETMDYSMREARGSMALFGEEVGVHIPRHLQTLIAEIPGVGLAFETMLPLVGVVAAIAIIVKLIEKHKEATEAMAANSASLASYMDAGATNTKIKLLELSKEMDELRGDHAAALIAELKTLDAQTLQHLGQEFDDLAKRGDKAFDNLTKKEASFWFGGNWSSAAAQVKADLDKYNLGLDDLVKHGTQAQVVASVMQHLTDVTAALAKEQALEAKETGHKDRVEALKQELSLASDLAQKYQEGAAVEDGQKTRDAAKEQIKVEAAAAAEFKKSSEIMHRAMEERKKDAEEAAKSAIQWANISEELDRAVAENKKKTGEEWLKENQRLSEEEGKQTLAMAKLTEAAQGEAARHALAMRTATAAQATALEIAASKERLQVETAGLDAELAALNAAGTKDIAKVREIEDKKTQVIREATNEQTKIRDAALLKQQQDTMRVETKIADDISKTLTQGILESKNMGQAFKKMGAEMLEAAMETAMKMVLLNKFGQLSDAKAAATAAYKSAIKAYPAPENMVLGVAQAAAAFAGAMSFESGGEIPGAGPVPIIGHGGETVVTKALTDQVRGSTGKSGGTFHFSNNVSAIDATGVDAMMKQHEHVIAARVTSILRKNHKRG